MHRSIVNFDNRNDSKPVIWWSRLVAALIWTPDTLRSPSQNEHFCVAEQNPKSLARMLPLMSVFWWSLFWSKTVFLPKKYHRLLGVKTYENHQNRCSLTVCFWVDLIKKYSFPVDAHVTQRMTRSIIFAQYQINYNHILQSFAPPALQDAV